MKNFKPILTAMSLCMALAAAAAPVRQHLHDDWQFRQARLNNWYPATVPGTVHTDLMANRIIEDPYFRLNERGVQWVDKEDWIYETHFEADAGLLARERIELVFEGLDTYADVYLNDEKVLAADNMFRRWRTEVKRLLRPGENTLKVYFHSPIKVDLPKYDSLPYRYEAVNDQSANGGLFDKRVSVFARKAGYHYGWDWGPRLVTSGIWRPVYLEGWSGARISDVFYRQQEVTARRARVEVEVEIASARDLAEAVVTVASPGEGIEASVTAPLRSGINKVTVPLDIASPKLWWTRELGESHLYEFRASVAAGDASDSRTTRIGLRSLRLVRDKVADGTTFYFELNGEPLFAKGANYIPCDVFLPRVTRAVYEKTIDDAAAVNMNMLRVWGGGVYEDDVFYELCDERGILVWQDFMFACSVYPAEGHGSKTSGSKPKTTSAVCAITPRSPYGAATTSATKRGSAGDGTPGTPNRGIPNGTGSSATSSAANTTKCCPKPSPPARPARLTTPRRPGRVTKARAKTAKAIRISGKCGTAAHRSPTTTPRAAASSANTASSRSPNTPPSCVSPPKSATGTSNRR